MTRTGRTYVGSPKVFDMPENVSFSRNRTVLDTRPGTRPAWAITVLASVLIFTTVVDVLGNLLVIISVLRNRKLRNAGKGIMIVCVSLYVCVCVCSLARETEENGTSSYTLILFKDLA